MCISWGHNIVKNRLIWCAGLLLIVSGCAGLNVKPAEQSDDGFRYYGTAPFLLVYTDNKGGLESEVHYLPDLTKEMSIKPYNYLASNKSTLKFEKGRLTSAKAVVDETAIPTSVIKGLEKVATALIKAANASAPQYEVPAPYLFRIVYKDDIWQLAGRDGVGTQGQGTDAAGSPVSIRVTRTPGS